MVDLLQQAFETPETPVVLQGEAVLGLEAAAASLISADDVVLNLVSGVFGKGFGYWAGGTRTRSSRSRCRTTAPSSPMPVQAPWRRGLR